MQQTEITLVFKASKKRTIIGESDAARLNTQLEDLYRRLDFDLANEKWNLHDLLARIFVN